MNLPQLNEGELKVHTVTNWKRVLILICRLDTHVHMHLLKLCRLLSVPASSAAAQASAPVQASAPGQASASGQVMVVADIHKSAEKEPEVEELNVTQEGKQVTQF